MKRTLLAAAASLALVGAATAADADGYGYEDRGPDPAWREAPPPRYEAPRYEAPRYGGDYETDMIVRRPAARVVERERHEDGVVIHERIVTERTIRPARPRAVEDADWYEDGPRPPRPIGVYAPPAYDVEPVIMRRPVVVGAVIPPDIVLRPVPQRYGYAGYHWVADPHGRRIVVEPHSRRVVKIVERW